MHLNKKLLLFAAIITLSTLTFGSQEACEGCIQDGWTVERTANTSKIPGSIAKKWCEYYKNICPCSKGKSNYQNTAAIGGTPALKEEFPHMAAIGYGPQNGILWQCGGSLISEDYVLTAAHCLSDGQYPAAWVRLGSVIVQDKSREIINGSKEGQTHPVLERIVHPLYKKPSKYHDIALLKIGAAIEDDAHSTLSKSIHPACLHSDEDIFSAVATGWGRLGPLEDPAPILQKVILLVYEKSECNKTYELEIRTTNQLQKGIHDSQICAGQIKGGIDTCQGDSGGPLQLPNEYSCLLTVVGLTSFGKVCGVKGTLGVYTRVSHYLEWIEDNAWKGREICATDKDHYGECLPLSNCTHIHQYIHRGYRPKQCGYDRKEPIVCCPSITQEIWVPPPRISNQGYSSNSTGNAAKRWCEIYRNEIGSMLKNEDNTTISYQNYPHLAHIGYGSLNHIQWECTGILISEDYVLVAAHCLESDKCEPAKWVRLGSKTFHSNLRLTLEDGTVTGQVHPITGILMHPEYTKRSKFNDLALLKIGEAVEPDALSTLSLYIHPACIQVSEKQMINVTAVGLDSLGIDDRSKNSIKEANMTTVNTYLCSISNGGEDSQSQEMRDQDNFFQCTTAYSWKGLCLFSLEGPLHVLLDQNTNLYEVMGLTAANQECVTGNPIAFTKIIPYLRWIEENVWPSIP